MNKWQIGPGLRNVPEIFERLHVWCKWLLDLSEICFYMQNVISSVTFLTSMCNRCHYTIITRINSKNTWHNYQLSVIQRESFKLHEFEKQQVSILYIPFSIIEGSQGKNSLLLEFFFKSYFLESPSFLIWNLT